MDADVAAEQHVNDGPLPRNAHTDWGDGKEPHHTAFLVGKISDVVSTASTRVKKAPEGRFLIKFSQSAHIDIPDACPKGHRNPVRYTTLEEMGIDPKTLKWELMPEATEEPTDEGEEPVPIAAISGGEALTIVPSRVSH